MKTRMLALRIVCVLGIVLGFACGSLAAVDTGAEPITAPVVTGSQLMQEKINFLMATLQDRLETIPETDRPVLFMGQDFSQVSGLDQLHEDILDPSHPLHDAVYKAGQYHQDSLKRPALADEANLYLNVAILDSLDELLKNPSMADDVKNTVFALIDLLKELELPEAYMVPDTRFSFTGVGRPDDRDRIDRENNEDQGGSVTLFSEDSGFKYYGKLYDLETDVSVDARGFIVFADGRVDTRGIGFGSVDPYSNIPAMLSPFLGLPQIRDLVVSGGSVDKTGLRYTFRWDVGFDMPELNAAKFYSMPQMPVMTTSASLYRNDWIVYDYQAPAGGWYFPLLPGIAGLSPGDGGEGSGHPGEGQLRDWESGAGFIFDKLFGGSPLTFGGDSYTAIYNGYSDGNPGTAKTNFSLPIVIADTFFIFRPYEWIENETLDGLSFSFAETPNKYMVSAGTRSILAGGLSSLDEAIGYVADDPELLLSIDRGENSHNGYGGTFVPGEMSIVFEDGAYPIDWSGYEFGLQTVGQDKKGLPAFFDTPHPLVGPGLDLINNDGFLAYAVQVEEDIVNRKILEMHQEAFEKNQKNSLADNISSAKGFSQIRERDDWLTRKSDAQAGRVLRDHKGNWVRVQQYVLRPDDNTVQILSASLRDVAGKSELSTLDFTTTFLNGGYSLNSDLRALPWNSWLNTRTGFTKGGVDFKYVYTTRNAPLLESMTVTIKNPSDDTFQESRTFAGELFKCYSKQLVNSEVLRVNDELFSNLYNYDAPDPSAIEYTVESGVGGFSYHPADRSDPINVSLYELSGSNAYRSQKKFKDIWDALRVNEGTNHDIGDNSLEMVITDGADAPRFNDFDVVYIPMSRMLWKDKTVDPS